MLMHALLIFMSFFFLLFWFISSGLKRSLASVHERILLDMGRQSTRAQESTRPGRKRKAHPQDMKALRRNVAQDERHHHLETGSSPTPQSDLTHATEQKKGIGRGLYHGAKPTH